MGLRAPTILVVHMCRLRVRKASTKDASTNVGACDDLSDDVALNYTRAPVKNALSDDVALNYTHAPVKNALGMGSSFNSPRSSLPNNIEFRDDWIFC